MPTLYFFFHNDAFTFQNIYGIQFFNVTNEIGVTYVSIRFRVSSTTNERYALDVATNNAKYVQLSHYDPSTKTWESIWYKIIS